MSEEKMKEFSELPENIKKAWKAIDDDKQIVCCYCKEIPEAYMLHKDYNIGKYACICYSCGKKKYEDLEKWRIPEEAYKYNKE